MRVSIINPPTPNHEKYIREGRCEQRASSFQYLMVPISLPSIAGLLRAKGFEVDLIDCMAEDLDTSGALKKIKKFKPKLAIINFSTTTFETDKNFTLALKKALPETHLSAIGVHVSALPEETLIETALDSIIRHEPEMTALELAQKLQKTEKLQNIKGLTYRGNPTFVSAPAREFIGNLDALPHPARDLLKNDRYKMPIYNRPYTLVITSRGCPNNCSFCTAGIYYGAKIRMRSVNSVLDEVEEIINRYKIKDITFWADTFTYNKKYVLDICRGIKARGLKFRWMANARVDRVDPEMLKAMKETGCQILSFGIESGVQKILDNVGKNITLAQIKQALRWTREAGIESAAHIIFGLPGETRETVKQTVNFVKKLNPDYVQFYSAIPFPGTRFYEQAKQKNWIRAAKWSDYEIGKNVISTPQLSVEDLAYLRKKAFLQFYLRPVYVWGRLKKFVRAPADFWPFVRQAVSFLKDWAEK